MSDPFIQFLFDKFCRHLVVCSCIHRLIDVDGEPKGNWSLAICSGIVLQFGEEWYLATAGHCLKDFQELVRREDLECCSTTLSSNFCPDSKPQYGLIFNLDEHELEYIDNDYAGIDLGLVRLNYLEMRALQQDGILPLSEANWMANPTEEIERYFLLGSPAEAAGIEFHETLPAANIKPTMFPVRPVDAQPEKPSAIPWLSFKISSELPIKDIGGMSGGPIIGARQEGDGFKYWVIALQSQWNKGTRFAFSCRLPEFSRIVETIKRNQG